MPISVAGVNGICSFARAEARGSGSRVTANSNRIWYYILEHAGTPGCLRVLTYTEQTIVFSQWECFTQLKFLTRPRPRRVGPWGAKGDHKAPLLVTSSRNRRSEYVCVPVQYSSRTGPHRCVWSSPGPHSAERLENVHQHSRPSGSVAHLYVGRLIREFHFP